jgi:hypothetical protein
MILSYPGSKISCPSILKFKIKLLTKIILPLTFKLGVIKALCARSYGYRIYLDFENILSFIETWKLFSEVTFYNKDKFWPLIELAILNILELKFHG